MAYQSFEDLEVWKRACRLAVEVTRALETCRNFGLRDQMQRAAVSVPSNIAEGYERDSAGDFIRFLRIAKGSAAELRTQLYIAAKLELLPSEKFTVFTSETRELSAMLQGLIRARRASLNLKP
jgi:four helix bundle protein